MARMTTEGASSICVISAIRGLNCLENTCYESMLAMGGHPSVPTHSPRLRLAEALHISAQSSLTPLTVQKQAALPFRRRFRN
jgi:hypothetical protein